MVAVTVTAKFHQPTRSRRREWQDAILVYRDTKQGLVNGWASGDLGLSVTTASIDNDLYSAVQNQAIREAKAEYKRDGWMDYTAAQPFATNNQNWDLETTGNGSVVLGFPCISQWWYTPIHVHDEIREPIERVLEGEAKNPAFRSIAVVPIGSVRSPSNTIPFPTARCLSASILATAISSPRTLSERTNRC